MNGRISFVKLINVGDEVIVKIIGRIDDIIKKEIKEGRLKNLKRISDIATFLDSKYNLVIISAVFPYQEPREYLDSICNNVLWVHLFNVDFRERQELDVKDFDLPYVEARKNCSINTTNFTPEMCIERLLDYISL
jgi:hypothetical protein